MTLLRDLGRAKHRCPLCQRTIAGTHFKRHLAAHDRDALHPTVDRDAAWIAFLEGRLIATGGKR